MGGRAAREKLAMKLPKFGQPQTVRPARRTDSLLNEVVSILMLILLTWLQSFFITIFVAGFGVQANSANTGGPSHELDGSTPQSQPHHCINMKMLNLRPT